MSDVGELARYIAKGKQLTKEYMHKAFGHLLSLPVEDLGEQVSRVMIKWDVFIDSVALLQERGLIINIVDFNPSRDVMLEWVTKNFVQDLNIKMTQLKVLAKYVFLLVLGKTEDRLRILEETALS